MKIEYLSPELEIVLVSYFSTDDFVASNESGETTEDDKLPDVWFP